MVFVRFFFTFLCSLGFSQIIFAQNILHHNMQIKIKPTKQMLEVQDQTQVRELFVNDISAFIYLNKNLQVQNIDGINIEMQDSPANVLYQKYKLTLPNCNLIDFTLYYSGRLDYPTIEGNTPGGISEQGVSLLSGVYWYPVVENKLLTFTLEVQPPENWKSVSQGIKLSNSSNFETWQELQPQDGFYLIAYPFTIYQDYSGSVAIEAYLRQADDALAQKYIGITQQYLDLYSNMIGSYPYGKFALVENYWETGFGMPSFTLLGAGVIRLPFILTTSYPHEILHNWWGNSVYINTIRGNWAEGLTSYLADHYLKIASGSDSAYRRIALKNFTDYVNAENEFPVARFYGRYDDISKSIGYDKVLMIFHMLKIKLGDSVFRESIQQLYARFKFKEASFFDIEQIFTEVSGKNLERFFIQWVDQVGLPKLRIDHAEYQQQSGLVKIDLKQTQADSIFELDIPISLYYEDGSKSSHIVPFDQRNEVYSFAVSKRVIRVTVDENFDVFRSLDPLEVPASLSEVIASSQSKVTFIVPSRSSEELQNAYIDFANILKNRYSSVVEVLKDDAISDLPEVGVIWILGQNNLWAESSFSELQPYGVSLQGNQITINQQIIELNQSLTSMVFRSDRGSSVNLVIADNPDSLEVFARKITHYGKYGAISFDLNGNNYFTHEWPSISSPLTVDF